MKKTITLILLLIVTVSGYSQFSKTHYIPPLTACTYMSSTTVNVDNYIYISTPSDNTKPVTVTITPLGGTPVSRTVTNTNPWVYMISAPSIPDPSATPTKPKPNKDAKDGQDTQLYVPSRLLGTVLKDRGYLIEATNFIYANVRVGSKVSSGGLSQAGGLVAKGLSAYGTEFRIGGMENRGIMDTKNGEALMNFASFVATEDNTTVTITLPKAPSGTFMYPKIINGNYPYGYPFPNSDFHYPPSGSPAPTSYTDPASKNHIYNGPITVTLNKNESYIVAMENSTGTTFESNYMLGGLIKSDRNIVVNCGSMAGNSQIKGEVIPGNVTPYNDAGKDYGFDQIVGSDKTGKEFIFVGGYGIGAKYYDLERAIIIANEDGTEVYKYTGTVAAPIKTLVKTLNAGEYHVFNGSEYTSGNLYVTTSKNVFAYQSVAGQPQKASDAAGNQNMVFVPPLNCATPSEVNNIPLINEIGLAAAPPTTHGTFPNQVSTNGMVLFPNTTVNIVTQRYVPDPNDPTKTIANKVYINNVELIGGMPGLTRTFVVGKTDVEFVVYTYKTPGGNMAITASAQVYVSFYGSNDNAAFGSYFSGFDTKPSISTTEIVGSICANGLNTLTANSAINSDKFEWLFNTIPDANTAIAIPGANGKTYTPTVVAPGKGAGYYFVSKISGCTPTKSNPIAVSACPEDTDGDTVLNNIDIDSDNDGITNTNESYGDKAIDVSGTSGTITAGSGSDIYNNSYTAVTTPTGAGNTFTGNANGSFATSVVAGNTNSVSYEINFPSKPVSIALQYTPAGATPADMADAGFEIKTSITTTITISNPTNQLLIDTDNDGIYESGVKEFSSFDIKFKLNIPVGATPDFKIQTYLANSINFTHTNISNSKPNSITGFSFVALSIPKDSDADGKNDQVDTDSDGDGILDIEEAQSVGPGQPGYKTLANADTNKNGLDNAFEPVVAPVDTDGDGIPDFIDLDSDNDGILDSVESGTIALAAATPKVDADSDGKKNYRELDSDNDTCFDINETTVATNDLDGYLGTTIPTPTDVDAKGKVNGGVYGTPSATNTNNYLTAKPQPIIDDTTLSAVCATRKAEITVVTQAAGTYTYKWFFSINSGPWTLITAANAGNPTIPNTLSYENYTTNKLSINNYADQYQYRAEVSNAESICLAAISPVETIIVTDAPSAANVSYPLCDGSTPTDNPMDGITKFDLTSVTGIDTTTPAPSTPNTITFHTTSTGASNNTDLIIDPANFVNTTSPFKMDVFARVQNSAGCYTVSTVALTVGAKLPTTYVVPSVPATVCDDAVLGLSTDTDGISKFDLTATKLAIENDFKNLTPTLPLAYTVYFYINPNDVTTNNTANAITNLANYRNTTASQETIYVRVNNNDANFTSNCYSSTQFILNVEALPTTFPVTKYESCDTDNTADGKFSFDTTNLESTLLGNPTGKTVVYLDANNNPLKDANGNAITSPFPTAFFTSTQQIKAVVSNTTAQKCSAAPVLIDFQVNPAPVVSDVTIVVCDTDLDGFASFVLTSKNNDISTNAATETFSYYASQAEALAGGPAGLITSPYTNTTIYGMDVWARVVSANNCSNVAKVTLKVVVAFPINYTTSLQPAPVCDDNVLGTDTDGISEFDLTVAKADIESNITAPGYTFTYYGTQADFNAKTNAITNFANYRNKTRTDLDIWVRVTNTLSTTCESSGKYIRLNVEAKPLAKATKELYKECDDDTDGQLTFINTVDQEVRKGRADVTIDYTDNATGVSLGSSFPTSFTTGNITVKAVVTNSTPQLCEDETLIVFQVDVKPVAVTTPMTFTECDNEADPMKQDGKYPFTDSATIQSTILGAQTDPQVMVVKYFAQDNSPLPSPLPATFLTGTQTVKYTVENINNLNNAGCTAQGTIQFTVNPLPKIDLNADGDDDKVICVNLPALTFNLDASIQDGSPTGNYTYQWAKDGVDLPNENAYTLNGVNTEGVYTVKVSNATCNSTRTINVTGSEIAEIVTIKVSDLTENNTITVNLKPGLKGNYEYSLDDEIGYYQDSNVFTNVSPGTHQLFVRDKNGCGIQPDVTAVIGVPKFFTPNNDGYNDTWNIAGISATTNYTIFIYDRYGKLLKELIPQSTQGWDGNFNLAPMPGSDYWYSLKLDNGREAKGHFSLKR